MAISTRLALAKRTTLTTCLSAALAAGALHAGALPASAKKLSSNTIPVTHCLDDGSNGSLRNAIEGAGDGDTIDMSGLTCSLITLQSGELQSPVANLVLQGPGRNALTIDGNNSDRVLHGVHLDISDLTIAHGAVLTGVAAGGCVLTTDDLSLTRARLTACIASGGAAGAAGGAAQVGGNLTMHQSTISGSHAIGDPAAGGGAIVGGETHLYDSVIIDNRAEATQLPAYGGGLFAYGLLTLDGSFVVGNTAHAAAMSAYGGGTHSPSADVRVRGSTISVNIAQSDAASSYGGGINSGKYSASLYGVVDVTDSTISGNTVESACGFCLVSGGGVQATNQLKAEYSTISDNIAQCDNTSTSCQAIGGGAAARGTQSAQVIALTNSTVSTNTATGGMQAPGFGGGAGFFVWPGKTFLAHNATVAFNHASDFGGGLYASAPASATSEMVSTIVSNNDSTLGADDISSGALVGLSVGGSNNLVMQASVGTHLPADTLSADPGLLALTTDDGGSTATHPLPAGSVAVDAGANPDSLGCDQRGVPYHRTHGTNPDIGAYEYQGEPHLFADGFDGPNPACLFTP